MLLIVNREPSPDALMWPGRRLLAVADAVGWPALLALLVSRADVPVGLVGPTFTALAVLIAFRRLYRAVWANHRCRFTTWRWGKVATAMILIGYVLKLMMVR